MVINNCSLSPYRVRRPLKRNTARPPVLSTLTVTSNSASRRPLPDASCCPDRLPNTISIELPLYVFTKSTIDSGQSCPSVVRALTISTTSFCLKGVTCQTKLNANQIRTTMKHKSGLSIVAQWTRSHRPRSHGIAQRRCKSLSKGPDQEYQVMHQETPV